MKKISIVTSLLWATAIVAAAIMHAPVFFTIGLLPLLAFFSLISFETLGSRSSAGAGNCL